MITREDAQRLAEADARATGMGPAVRGAYLRHEISGREPLIYGGPNLDSCWIVYIEPLKVDLRSSIVVLVDRSTGAILYRGSANDEG